MFRFSTHVFLLLMVGGFWACSDHRIPAVAPGSTDTRLRVKTLTLELPGNAAKVSSFRYDAQGRLSSILTYQMPDSSASVIEYSNYQYDGQNRLTGLRREVVLHPRGSGPNPVEEYSYSYNGAGQVSGVSYLTGGNGGSLSFVYGADNQVVRGTGAFPIPLANFTFQESFQFTFTGKNLTNLARENNVFTRGPFITVAINRTFAHDTGANPFYGVYVIPAPYVDRFINTTSAPGSPYTYFGGVDNVLTLSQNNVLTEVSTTTISNGGTPAGPPATMSTTYQYQYNAAALPTVRIKTSPFPDPTNGLTVETLRFGYESY